MKTRNKSRLGVSMKPCKTELGKFLRAKRLEKGLTQEDVAKYCGVSAVNISKIETGTIRPCRCFEKSKIYPKLAKLFGVDEAEIKALIPEKFEAESKTELGRFIRARRKTLGLSIKEFAERLHVRIYFIRQIEIAGKTILYKRARQIANALEIDVKELSKFIAVIGVKSKKQSKTNSFGDFVREHRKILCLSTYELSELLDVSRNYVSLVELGKTNPQKKSFLEKLAKVLCVDVVELETCKQKSKKHRSS